MTAEQFKNLSLEEMQAEFERIEKKIIRMENKLRYYTQETGVEGMQKMEGYDDLMKEIEELNSLLYEFDEILDCKQKSLELA